MSRQRLIGQREEGASIRLPSFPSSPESSDGESLVYQREATSEDSGIIQAGKRLIQPSRGKTIDTNGRSEGSEPLTDSRQKRYSAIDSMPERERMDMEYNGKTTGPTFSQKKGFFVERRIAFLLVALVIAALLLVGLLVGFLAPGKHTTSWSSNGSDEDNGNQGDSSNGPKVGSVRLPTSVIPVSYEIQLQPFLNGNLSVPGTLSLWVECLQETTNVTLNVNNVNVTLDSVKIADANGTRVPIDHANTDTVNQFFVIYLGSSLRANLTYQINMTYIGVVNEVLAGLYKSSYQSGNQTKYLAVTQFEATDARRVFPCFDEPAFKAIFNISIIREANLTSISNGPLIRSERRNDGWFVDYFGPTPKMSTYLVALVISDFVNITKDSYGVWARKDVIDSAEYPLSIGPKLIKYYDNFFNISYPMVKMDNVAIPDFNAGAMENWGLITFRETSMLYDHLLSTAHDMQYICQTVAHELAHQWFGNLVTPAWWNDLWLNEGFASYMEYVSSDYVQPEWKMMELFVTDMQQSALRIDSLKSSHPISFEVSSPNEINDLFDTVVYDKGASIIRMMHFFLGNETFQVGLQTYLKAFKYSNAKSDDLWNHLSMAQNSTGSENPVNVTDIMRKWSKQTGYPLLTVTRNHNDSSINLTQSIFLMDNSNLTEEEGNVLWDVPVTWASAKTPVAEWNTMPSMWLPNRTMIIPSKSAANDWIVYNIQAAGFYRVNYDLDNWNMLINQLQKDHTKIDIITRTQLIDDAFNLAKAGIIPYAYPLDLTNYLKAETEYLPFNSALYNIGTISGLLSRSDMYGDFRNYVVSLMMPTYNRLGWSNLTTQSVQTQYLQIKAISTACARDHSDCVTKATTLFNQWKSDPNNKTIINPNWRYTVYCTGVAHGNSSDWDFVWNRFKNETVPAEKGNLEDALSCSKEMWILEKYLKLSLKGGAISPQDVSDVIVSVAKSDHGRELAFNFVQENWDKLFQLFGETSFILTNILDSISGRLTTEWELSAFLAFKNKVFSASKAGTGKSAFNRGLEVIQSNVQFMNRSYEAISDWLKGKTPNMTSQNLRLLKNNPGTTNGTASTNSTGSYTEASVTTNTGNNDTQLFNGSSNGERSGKLNSGNMTGNGTNDNNSTESSNFNSSATESSNFNSSPTESSNFNSSPTESSNFNSSATESSNFKTSSTENSNFIVTSTHRHNNGTSTDLISSTMASINGGGQ